MWWDGGRDDWGHVDESEMHAEESEMIGDGWGHADEAYHDSMGHSHVFHLSA